jgi:uncharacterized protein (TIGR02452 family)
MPPFDFTYTPARGVSRADGARQGAEAVAIARAGCYVAPSGRRVDLEAAIARAVLSTRDYPPDAEIPRAELPSPHVPRFEVTNGTSLGAARAIAARGQTPFVLNFASAKHPGGGFLSGARAQEESLARASALYACIEGSPMYPYHRARSDAMYTSWMIHTPDVPVFRHEETGALLEEPYACAFLTAPAPNAGVVLQRAPERRAELSAVLAERTARVLAIAAAHGHRHLVLGAWGCGVFENDPAEVALHFGRAFAGPLGAHFDEVVFAVLDWSKERRFVRPFVEQFEGRAHG